MPKNDELPLATRKLREQIQKERIKAARPVGNLLREARTMTHTARTPSTSPASGPKGGSSPTRHANC